MTCPFVHSCIILVSSPRRFQSSARLKDVFSISVTQHGTPIFFLIVNPPNTTPVAASQALKLELSSAAPPWGCESLAGVATIGRRSVLCTTDRTRMGYLHRIDRWKEDLESDHSLKQLGVYAAKVKDSLQFPFLEY
jgi:hypothetical protein